MSSANVGVWELTRQDATKHPPHDDVNKTHFMDVQRDVMTWVISISLFTTAILTLLGNSLVLITFFMDKRLLRSNFNVFLLNLTITDIAVSVTAIPLYGIDYFYGEWPSLLGPYLCALWMFCDWGMTFASVYTLLAISVDRLWAVLWSHHYRANNTKRRVTCMVSAIWVMVLVIWLPAYINDQVRTFDSDQPIPEHSSCMWSIQSHENHPFAIFMAVAGYHIPTLVIILCYVSVFVKMRKSRANLTKHAQAPTTRAEDVAMQTLTSAGTYDSSVSDNYGVSADNVPAVTVETEVAVTGSADQVDKLTENGKLSAAVVPHYTKNNNSRLSLDKYKSTSSLNVPGAPNHSRVSIVRPNSFTEGVVSLNPAVGHPQSRHLSAASQIAARQNGKKPLTTSRASSRLRARNALQYKDYRLFVRVSYIIVAYLVCWTPFHIVFDLMLAGVEVDKHWYAFATLMCYLNSTLNPVLYALGNPKMKLALKNTLSLRCKKR